MITELRCKNDVNAPIFHSVDMDWRQDGFIFQYSKSVEEEAETTIHTLLPILQHFYPNAFVESNFSEDAIERCTGMVWDSINNCVIDPVFHETADFTEEEALPGFVFDESALNDLQHREVDRNPMPNDSDSVSTFRPAGQSVSTSRTSVTIPAPIIPTTPASTLTNHTSTASVVTGLTNDDSFKSLDSRISGLASQMLTQQSKHDQQYKEQQATVNKILIALETLTKNSVTNQTVNNNSITQPTQEASTPSKTGTGE